MADLQVTQEVVVELNDFHNVDLFQRGYYQVRCHVESPSKLTTVVDCELKQEGKGTKTAPCLFQSFVDKHSHYGISKTFEVYYKHEEIPIKDCFIFKIDMLVDGNKIESQVPQKLNLVLELYFTECTRKNPATPKSLEHVSSQTLTLHLSFGKSFHAHRSILFDYFHLGALTLTVHSCIIAFRQPWSAVLKSLHPVWNGKSGNIRQYCYNALFGKGPPMSTSQKLDNRQKGNATFIHRKLCLQLLKLYEQVLSYYHIAIACLPDSQQMRLSKVDIQAKLNVLNNEFEQLATAEDNYLRMGDDLYLLSTELSMLWLQFNEQFMFDGFIHEKLLIEHHYSRTEHLREAFFSEEHPWEALCTSLELSTSQQLRMSSIVKSSLYYQLIPPVHLECSALDGNNNSLPIVFEDKYIPGKRLGDAGLKRANSFSMTVEENIVGDDFVDMDVSIEDCQGNVRQVSCKEDDLALEDLPLDDDDEDILESNPFDDDDPPFERKSSQIKRYASVNTEWDFANSPKFDELKETALTDSVELTVVNTDNKVVSAENKIVNVEEENKKSIGHIKQISTTNKKKLTKAMSLPVENMLTSSPSYQRHPKLFKKSSSVFYSPLENSGSGRNSPQPSIGEDALIIEELNIDDALDGDIGDNTSLQLACKGPNSLNSQIINHAASPSDPPKAKLWSCFPAIKSGSSKKNSYKMTMASPPYMPVAREQSTRFQRAKDNLQMSCNFPGHHYRLLTDEVEVKPYYSEKVVATTENVHLVICVHGLDGNSGDLRLVKCYLEMALPRANFDFLMSEVNQDDTFCDIDDMTIKLVREILDYIDEQKLDVVKLSFVGHSLGNIIIRNTVVHSHMFQYRNKLHTFLSLSGPHLGMQFHTSNLVSTGMWLMQKWKKQGSLVQLALNDATDPRDTFMYHLSLTNGFQYFKNVLLVSSVQDHYVPFHSARVEMSKQVAKDNTEGGRVYKEMLDNIMNPMMVQEEININRYSVYHPMASSANTLIGRAAHIAMLDSELFLEKFILITASKYFR